MACRVIHTWTFCSLVGAFLDLGLAYLFLCGSTIAFFSAKFLGLFGLSLPCPCNGLFGDPDSGNSGRCIQRMLVEYPARRISSVQMLAQRRFPFDRIFVKGDCTSNVKLLEDGGTHSRLLETGSGDSRGHTVESICSAYTEGQGMNNLVVNEAHSSSELDGENFAVQYRNGRQLEQKGKALWIPKPRPSLRRRRKAGVQHGRTSNAASAIHLRLVGRGNSVCNSEQCQETSDESFTCSCSRGSVQHCIERSHGEGHVERTLSGSDSNGISGEQKNMVGGPHEKRKFGENEAIDVQDLERSLKAEHTATSALYLELEEERNAAATAADEAMAMISRLQEEKAVVEMEARQYRRMIEEKAAYDAEEMNILKEILLRREREKLVLEKEVEVYREILFTGKSEQSEEDDRSTAEATLGKGHGLSFDMNDDPEILLQQISASLVKRKAFRDASSFNADLGPLLEAENNFKNSPLFAKDEDSAEDKDTAKHLDVYGSSDQASSSKQTGLHGLESSDKHSVSVDGSTKRFDVQFDEKTMLSIGDPTNSQSLPSKLQDGASQSCCHPAQGIHDNSSSLHPECKLKGNEEGNAIYNATSERGHCPCVSRKEHDILLYDPDQLGDHVDVANHNTGDYKGSAFDPESGVYDVHVVNDNIQISKIDSGQESEGLSSGTKYSSMGINDHSVIAPRITNGDASSDRSSSNKNEGRSDLIRSGSEMNIGAHTWDGRALSVDLRRHSISVVEGEKLRLNNEVGKLIERLRTVQKSRDKLSLSLEHREKEKTHMQLLEQIVQQLREIRELTEPGNSVRQASLPPLSSKMRR
ncbi:Myosin-binding protein 3 [Nymphaea thermarum]|nr:Myosin-binding protein 3 [Nymphaea thermarum]